MIAMTGDTTLEAALEERARADYRRVAGKILRTTYIQGYGPDDAEDSAGIYADPSTPFVVRIDDGLPDEYITHTNDEWIDPYWDCTPVYPDPRLAAYRSFWVDGISYNTQTGERHAPDDLIADDAGDPIVWEPTGEVVRT